MEQVPREGRVHFLLQPHGERGGLQLMRKFSGAWSVRSCEGGGPAGPDTQHSFLTLRAGKSTSNRVRPWNAWKQLKIADTASSCLSAAAASAAAQKMRARHRRPVPQEVQPAVHLPPPMGWMYKNIACRQLRGEFEDIQAAGLRPAGRRCGSRGGGGGGGSCSMQEESSDHRPSVGWF